MYILIYYKTSYINKCKNIFYVLASFLIPFIIISNLLISLGVTDRKLWDGSEPYITSMLKGSNIEHFGGWNEADAKFINKNLENRENLEKEAKDIIIERYTKTSRIKLGEFIIGKIIVQWSVGDFSGAFWAEQDVPPHKIKLDIMHNGKIWYQYFYAILLLLVLKGLFNKQLYSKNRNINLFYIIFCGYGLMLLLIECQPRYGFIINWVFIILALSGFTIKEKEKDLN